MEDQNNTQQDVSKQLGAQGNEGQYGQGQYDSEGKPDPRGAQEQRIEPVQKEIDQQSGNASSPGSANNKKA